MGLKTKIGRFKTPCSLGWNDRYPNQTWRIAGIEPTKSNLINTSKNKKVFPKRRVT